MFKRDYPDQNALARAIKSLDGLTVGDQFGEMFFIAPEKFQQAVNNQAIPTGAWNYTDDTEMALSIVSILAKHGQIYQDELMRSFAQHHDITRGYGPSMSQGQR